MQTIDFLSVIRGNSYINTKKITAPSVHSFCTLVEDRVLTQSQNITLGNCMEPFFIDVVRKNENWKDIRATILAEEGKENQTNVAPMRGAPQACEQHRDQSSLLEFACCRP